MIKKKKRVKSGISQYNFLEKNRRGVSPVIATVLLISMVIIIGIIIFLWFRGMIDEGSTKFGKNIELACDDVVFDASYSGTTLYITNDGNVPIYDFQIKFSSFGSHETNKLSSLASDTWEKLGEYRLTQGKTFSGIVNTQGKDKITLTPILLGKTSGGDNKEFVCNEKQYGYEIAVE